MRVTVKAIGERLRDASACETCRRYRRATLLLLGLLLATWILV